MNVRQIMTADELRRALVRISHEIVEKHGGTEAWPWWASSAEACPSPLAWPMRSRRTRA